jgi:hypothetical protein
MKTCRAQTRYTAPFCACWTRRQFEDFLRNLGTDVAQILNVDAIKLVLESPEAAPDPALARISDVLCVMRPGICPKPI